MDSKTKKILLSASIAFTAIFMVSMFYTFNKNKDFEFRSGTYFCKITILDEATKRVYKWDVGISKNNIKNNVKESELNKKALENFRKTINEISSKKLSLFLLILYLTFVIIVYVSVQKDSKIYQIIDDKKSFQYFITLLMIFLIYKVFISYIKLDRLHKDAIYFFKLIS